VGGIQKGFPMMTFDLSNNQNPVERRVEKPHGRSAPGDGKYISTKTYGHELGLSCCFRQWKAESHCRYLHGYALAIRIEFEADELDERNWVVDFGGLKSLKSALEATFDHKMLVAIDDPLSATFRELEIAGACRIVWVPATGCEAMAKEVFDLAEQWLSDNGYAPRVSVRRVEVSEHGANSAIYEEELKEIRW
jgi:6-pyruvoyltetrahydropterin/6-carboxytetrahydropterin synthase